MIILIVICFARTNNKSINRHISIYQAYCSAIHIKLIHLQRRAWHNHQFILGGSPGRRTLRAQDFGYYSFFFYISSIFYCSGEETERKTTLSRERPGRLTERRCPARRQHQPGDTSDQSAVVRQQAVTGTQH